MKNLRLLGLGGQDYEPSAIPSEKNPRALYTKPGDPNSSTIQARRREKFLASHGIYTPDGPTC